MNNERVVSPTLGDSPKQLFLGDTESNPDISHTFQIRETEESHHVDLGEVAVHPCEPGSQVDPNPPTFPESNYKGFVLPIVEKITVYTLSTSIDQ